MVISSVPDNYMCRPVKIDGLLLYFIYIYCIHIFGLLYGYSVRVTVFWIVVGRYLFIFHIGKHILNNLTPSVDR